MRLPPRPSKENKIWVKTKNAKKDLFRAKKEKKRIGGEEEEDWMNAVDKKYPSWLNLRLRNDNRSIRDRFPFEKVFYGKILIDLLELIGMSWLLVL